MSDVVELPSIVEGKSKKLYDLGDGLCFMVMKPHIRSISAHREGNIIGTDHERAAVSLHFMKLAEAAGIPTQMVGKRLVEVDGREGVVVKKTRRIPIEFIVRYVAAGSIVRTFPHLVYPGQRFEHPLYKYELKQDITVSGLEDPTINESYIVGLGILSKEDLECAQEKLYKVGELVRDELSRCDVELIDLKVEFGFDADGNMLLIDEISQDTMRSNDKITGRALTKDAYRQRQSDGAVLAAYKELGERLSNLAV